MRTANFKAEPMSRKSIRAIVKMIKKKCGLVDVYGIFLQNGD